MNMFGILIFGDSIIFGRGEKPSLGWVGKLKEYFERQDPYNAVYNLGIPGDATDDLLERFDTEAKARVHYSFPDDKFIIFFGIGTNDARCIGNPENYQTAQEKFRKNILYLIKKAKKYTKQIAFVGLLPVDEKLTAPFEDTYFTNKRQKEYNKIIEECCQQENIAFIDVFGEWFKADYENLLEDGLHPNSKGYENIFRTIKESLIKKGLMK